MGNQQSGTRIPNYTRQPSRVDPYVQFRVLIIGRANAGKTSILQRICDTTESPIIYRGKREVRLDPSMERGEHTIDDELVFSNHKGYVFHDSRGIESGSTEELEILREFIQRKCGEKRLGDKLHAIWYCVPMDNHRPQLDLKFYKDICPDQNVPVIVVFTKYDQFLLNVEMHISDYPNEYPDNSDAFEVAQKRFQERYLHPLGNDIKFVQLQKMHMENARCNDLIEKTAAALTEDIVTLMLFAVQGDNLQLSVKSALNRVNCGPETEVKQIIQECLFPFVYIWFPIGREDDLYEYDFFDLELYSDGYYEFPEYYPEEEERYRNHRDYLTKLIMKLPSIKTLTRNNFGHHHLILAVIIILKHATFLRLLYSSSGEALRTADLHYQQANIDQNIQEYLTTACQEQSVTQFVGFIMATNIESMQYAGILVPSQSLSKTHA